MRLDPLESALSAPFHACPRFVQALTVASFSAAPRIYIDDHGARWEVPPLGQLVRRAPWRCRAFHQLAALHGLGAFLPWWASILRLLPFK